jgi:L-2,4-diaminobutyric acid acetyltransferase
VTGVTVTAPSISDGAAMWRLARDSGALDLNSSYAYLLWCRDFAGTSAIATAGGDTVGFVTGYLRPARPDTLVIWQVAVDSRQRRRGVASMLLDDVLRRTGPAYLETTITADNDASISVFARLAARWGTTVTRSPLLETTWFPDSHPAEDLHRIGPFAPSGRSTGEL